MKSNYLSRAQAAFVLLMLLFTFSLGVKANSVDVERARQVAKTFLNNNGAQSRDLREISTDAGFSNLYVFTTANSFVLIAADDCVQPVLGYSLKDGFITENMPENIRKWLQNYGDQIQYVIESSLSPTQEVTRQWQELVGGTVNTNRSRTVVAPLITTTWNQGIPYNMLCPQNTPTGCVATAMAQIMKYWNYPAHGIGWHSYTHPEYGEQTANFNVTNYDWANMIDYYGNGSSQQEKEAVATLMYHCGVAMNMNYGPSESGANSYITPALFNYFNYSSTRIDRYFYNDDEWITMIRSEINASRPVFYCGGGHAFVCDGYDSGTYNNYYFHFNWGWGGYCDGYYSIDNMTPSGSDFSNFQDATIDIRPSTNNAIPTNLTYTQNGRNVTLHWTSASGAVSYNIYRDMYCVGNVTTNSYTEMAPYGTSVYYVRSVDNNGELSLSSNIVSVSLAYQLPLVSDLSATVLGDDVNLSWTAPEWCYPQTPTATLTYGEGPGNSYSGSGSGSGVFYAHRFLATNLAQYANKSVYKVETSVCNAQQSTINVYIYNNTLNNNPDPNSLVASVMQTFSFAGTEGLLYLATIDLPDPIIISGTTDLWIVISQVIIDGYSSDYSGAVLPSRFIDTYNPDACYYGTDSQTMLTPFPYYENWEGAGPSWPINTYLTDGTYSYNIYRNGTNIASNVSNTSYSDNNLPNGSYTYYIKTNYYAGESAASNSVTAQVDVTWYTIGTSCEPTNGGTVTGEGTYYNGQSCMLTATPAPGYAFVKWTKNGMQVSTNPNYTFNVTESANYVAHFQLHPYTVTVNADPTTGGTVSGGGTFTYGQSCTVHSTANTGYNFVNWTENGTQVSANPNYTFTVTGNRTLVANFQPQNYTITATTNPTEGGTITGAGTYNYGQNCTLTATANQGYTFVNWTKNGTQVSTNANYTFTVIESASYVAHFQAQSYSISVSANPTEGGTVSGGGMFTYGQSCTVHSMANTGYNFVNWTENGTQVSANPNYTFTVTGNRTLVANFHPQSYTITATTNPTEGGTITGAGTYNYGQNCTLTATANQGYTFVNWTKNGTQVSTNANYTFTVIESASYVAHFQAQSYSISVSANPTEGGTVSGGGMFTYGQSCTVHSMANTGYNFVNWTENGTQVSTNPNYTFTVIDHRNLVAHFSMSSYIITATVDPAEGGTVSGSGGYNYGDQCTLVATANQGYTFVNWTKNGTQVSSNSTYTFNVTESAIYVAHFQAHNYTISVTADPTEGGTVSGGGIYTYGQTCTLNVEPHENYTFINWTENGVVVSEEQKFSFTVEGSRSFVAHLFYYDGLSENQDKDINIYPNPVTNTITIKTSHPVNKWEIFNMSGAMLFTVDESTDMMEFQVSHFASGTYIIRLTTNNTVFTRKFVKK